MKVGQPMIRRRKRPKGLTLIEAGVALALATMAALAVVELVGVAAQQRRIGRQRELARMEVANQAERVALRSWDECAPGEFTAWEPSDVLAAEVPNVKCTAHVTETDGSPRMRRIDLQVEWMTGAEQSQAPARLTIWKFHHGEQP